MNKNFFDTCYAILSYYQYLSDVSDTYECINEGRHYLNNFPQNEVDFLYRKNEIVSYITKVRLNNVIDSYRENDNPLLFVPVPSGRLLSDLNPEELYQNLSNEIPRLIMKGIHQTIKHLNTVWDDSKLTAELLQQDTSVLQKYGLLNR